MGREVRRVPADWVHPEGKALLGRGGEDRFGGYNHAVAHWELNRKKWNEGFKSDRYDAETGTWTYVPRDPESNEDDFIEWCGERPVPEDYMPEWSPEEATHYMMYETCSEGTPISPAFATPEELARWLADNNASSFAAMTASCEAWLRVCKGGFCMSGVIIPGQGIVDGVTAFYEKQRENT